MSQIYLDPRPDPGRAGDGSMVAAHGDRQGNLYVTDIVRAAAIAGKLFLANYGTLTTPLASPATTAITAQRPQAWLRIPEGKVIYVVRHVINVESHGATTQGEIAVCTTTNDVGDGTGADATSLRNANPGHAGTPSTTGRQLATGDITAETARNEVDRFSFAASAVNQKFELNANDLGVLIPIRGASSFLTYIGGNAVQFYAQTLFIEEDEELSY